MAQPQRTEYSLGSSIVNIEVQNTLHEIEIHGPLRRYHLAQSHNNHLLDIMQYSKYDERRFKVLAYLLLRCTSNLIHDFFHLTMAGWYA